MSRTVAIAAALMVPAAAVWLAFGFMAWQWNPAHWMAAGRGIGVAIWALLASFMSLAIVPEKKRRRL